MKEKNSAITTVKSYLLALISCLCLITADQLTKLLAVVRLNGREPFVIWKGVFALKYLENKGAAFGMMQGGGALFLVPAGVVILAVAVLYGKLPHTKRFYLLRVCVVLLCSGAAGNMIDRVRNGYVRDFFYFELINFPIFNMADCYVVISALLFFFALMFYYRDEELKCLSLKRGEK